MLMEAWKHYYEFVQTDSLDEKHAKEVKEWLEAATNQTLPKKKLKKPTIKNLSKKTPTNP